MPDRSPPDGSSERIAGLYERHALAWDADRRAGAWNDKPWHDRFASLLVLHAHVLDLGCGSGFVAQHLVRQGFRITGIDSSPTLVGLCRDCMPEQEWLVQDMRSLRLPRTFDGVLAWDSVFHLAPDDQRAMIATFARHAAPAACLMFNAGPSCGEAIGHYRGEPLYHASLDSAEYRTRLSDAGFEILDHAIEDWKTGGGRTVWLARSKR